MTILEAQGSNIIVETIIAMAHSMRMAAVAEVIDSDEILQSLASKRCDLAPGYYISHPVPAESISALYAERVGHSDRLPCAAFRRRDRACSRRD
jgi:EAL domain-containing protein (putative c-di-GMP-specific phosphodiesterase class I)